MEQKHIDEIDESFLGEELIDEEDVSEDKNQEEAKPKRKLTKKEKLKEEKKAKNSIKKANKEIEKKEEVTITPVKEELKTELETKKEDVSDPWKEGESEESFFKEASTWKAITGVVIILLLLSVFTQGFHFSSNTETGAALTLSEAEGKAVEFVNSNLLKPPFEAALKSSAEVNNLYKITLDVAGEEVDSYITKDGKLFFPQGFLVDETSAEKMLEESSGEKVELDGTEEETENVTGAEETEVVAEEEAPAESIKESGVEEVESGEGVEASGEETVTTEENQPVVKETPEAVTSGKTVKYNLQAKRWMFTPQDLTAQVGDKVELTIVPVDLDFTFAIPELGVEKEISGQTVVDFTVSKAGSFEFKCSSCEDKRGMAGTLEVK